LPKLCKFVPFGKNDRDKNPMQPPIIDNVHMPRVRRPDK
jgi:hypothetical protein